MRRDLRTLAAAVVLLIGMATADPALAQKPGGILRVYFFDSPASMSIHEETMRPALTASSRQRCSRASSRSGLGSSFLRG